MTEFVEIPILEGFDCGQPPVGVVRIRKDAIPAFPDWVLSVGAKILEMQGGAITKYELVSFGLVKDSSYRDYLGRLAATECPTEVVQPPIDMPGQN